MKTTGYIAGLIFCMAFSSCDKINLPDNSLEDVFGHWQLYGTSGGFGGGGVYGLDVTKVSISITDFGKYYEYYDGDETAERNYVFVQGSEINESDGYYIKFTEMSDMGYNQYLRIGQNSKDTLYLSETYDDGFTYSYVRDN